MATIKQNVATIKAAIDTMKTKLNLPASATLEEVTEKAGSAKPKLQAKTVTPDDESDLLVTYDDSYDGLDRVTVKKINSNMISSLRADIIKRGEEVLDLVGTYGPTSQIKTVTPSKNRMVVTPDGNIEFLSQVTVEPVNSSIDQNIAPKNIKKDVEILGVKGTFAGDYVFEERVASASANDVVVVTPSAGTDAMTKVTIGRVTNTIDSNIKPENIKQGEKILGVTGTYAPAPSMLNKTVNPSLGQVIVYPDEGYGTMDKVTVNPVTASIDSSITPSNIRENVNILGVVGSLQPVKGEEITINPSIDTQTFTPSNGKNAITKATVNPVTSDIDTNIVSNNIKEGITILGVEGTFNGGISSLQNKTVTPTDTEQKITADEGYGALSQVTIEPTPTEDITIEPSMNNQTITRSSGKFINSVTVPKVTSDIDENIKPENIKMNMSILNVVGTYEGEKQEYFSAIKSGNYNCPGIGYSIIDVPDSLAFATTSGAYAFANLPLTRVPALDYSQLTDMSNMFYNCTKISNWDNFYIPESITKASYVISKCKLPSKEFVFNLPNLTSAESLFYEVLGINSGTKITLNISSKCTTLASAFVNSTVQNVEIGTLNNEIAKVNMDSTFMATNNIYNLTLSDNIRPTSLRNTFYDNGLGSYYNSGIKHMTINITECTTMNQMHYRHRYVQTVTFTGESRKLTDMYRAFYANSSNKLTAINGYIYGDSLINLTQAFTQCNAVVTFTGIKNLGMGFTAKSANFSNYTLDLSSMSSLSYASAISIIDGLYDLNLTYDVANGGTLYEQKVRFHANVLNLLSDDDKAIAAAKGWTISQ